MPWTVDDVEKFKKGLSDKGKKQYVRIANSVLKRLMDKGMSEKDAAASAIKQANGVVINTNSGNYSVYRNKQKLNYDVNLVVHQEKAHLVIPVVMMVEGVHNGNQGAIYHPIEELGKVPASWNGIPVVINHPEEEGIAVSANSPDIIDNVTVGRVYNTSVDGNKLKAEVWIDEDKLNTVCPKVLDNINDTKEVEVSLGMFTDNEESEGEWNGEKYVKIARNHRPDHLAILPDAIGACSCADGCGLGANKLNTENMEINATVTDMAAKRKELGMSLGEFYAIPGDNDSDSHLPIFDEAHVRAAMSRWNQVKGVSAEEKASAHSKIAAKAKKLKIAITNFSEDVSGQSIAELCDNKDASYNELMDAMRQKVNGLDNETHYHSPEDLFPNHVIYSKRPKYGSGQQKMFKQKYTYDNGSLDFSGNPVEVRKKIDYVNANKDIQSSLEGDAGVELSNFINLNKEVKQMANEKCPKCLEKVNALIANKQTKFAEADREWLLTQDEVHLDKLFPEEVAPVEKVVEKVIEVNKLSPEDQADLAWARRTRKEKRESIIRDIQANTETGVWDDVTLNAFTDDVLDKMAKSIKKEVVADYSLNANVQSSTGSVDILYPAGVEIKK